MPIRTESFVATDVLSAKTMATGRAGVWFLNWDIRPKPIKDRGAPASVDSFKGPGLYALCFDGQLIYIGSYIGEGKEGAYFTGDVAAARWWTHVGAITVRGSRVHVSPGSLKDLAKDPGPEHPMVAGLLTATPREVLHQDRGNLSPLRRLQYAAQNERVFFDPKATPEEVISRFTFVYSRIEEAPNQQGAAQLKERVLAAEQRLIETHAPACNTTHIPRNARPVEVRCAAVGRLMERALSRRQRHPTMSANTRETSTE